MLTSRVEFIKIGKRDCKMGRYYKLTKAITEDMAAEILREMRENKDVINVEFMDDNTRILVETEKEKYPEVMYAAVNIFSRIGDKCELTFGGFQHE